MRPIILKTGAYTAGSATVLAASQVPTANTPLVLASTVLDTPRRVVLTVGADAVTTRTLTLVGTAWDGSAQSEVIAVPTGAGALVSALDYKTVTSATPKGAGWSANVSLGTSATGTNTPMGSSSWARCDDYGQAAVAFEVDVTGTVSVNVESSMDDPNLVLPQVAVPVGSMIWVPHANIAAKTASIADVYAAAPAWIRLTQLSGAGSATLTVRQAGGKGG